MVDLSRTAISSLLLLSVVSLNAASIDEFSDGVFSWTANGSITGSSESGGVYSASVGGSDPFFSRAIANSARVETSANSYVHVRLKKDAALGGDASIFWQTNTSFTGTKTHTFTTTQDGLFHDYVIDLSGNANWTSTYVGGFRLDPANAGTGAFQVDYIRISNSATDSLAYGVDNFSDGVTSNWTFSGGVGSISEATGIFSATSTSGDPYMSRSILDIDGSLTNLVRIRMALSGGAASQTAQIFWANEDGNFAAQRSQTFTVTADGVLRDYEIDLSGHADWNGKIIDAFRLDPTNVSGIGIQVDSIEIVSIPEASVFAVLGMGGLLLVFRRRR